MLVLGDSEKIILELRNRTESAANVSDAGSPSGFTQTLDFGSKDAFDNDDFSLKKIRKAAIDKIEKEVIAHVLDKTDWNRSKATKILKISYKTLLYKISDLGIVPPKKFEE